MSAANFNKGLYSHADVTRAFVLYLVDRIRHLSTRMTAVTTQDAEHRLVAELLRMARPDVAVPNLWVIHPLPPLREIASRISTTRETVARALSQLYPTGLVRRKGKSLYIPDRDKFEAALDALQREGGGHHHL